MILVFNDMELRGSSITAPGNLSALYSGEIALYITKIEHGGIIWIKQEVVLSIE